MNIFRRSLLGLSLAIGLATTASAQTYGSFTLSAVPAIISASVTTNVAIVLDCRQNRHLSIQVTASGISNVTSVLTLNWAKSVDSANFESTASFTVPLAFTATANCSTNYNIDLGAVGFVKLLSLVNSTNTCTNVSVVCSQKPGI